MENLFDITLQNRKNLYRLLEHLPKDQLLKIPEGYPNNIWWNITHVLVTQQLLVYKFSGLQMRIPDELVDKFKKGTVPDGTSTDEEMKVVAGFLLSAVEWSQEDYFNGLFKTYNEYTTSASVTLRNVEDAIAFNAYHEGLHMGTILSLRKMLK